MPHVMGAGVCGDGLVRGMVWSKGAEEELGAEHGQGLWRPPGEDGRWKPS